jgi:hypothetical protein
MGGDIEKKEQERERKLLRQVKGEGHLAQRRRTPLPMYFLSVKEPLSPALLELDRLAVGPGLHHAGGRVLHLIKNNLKNSV